MEDITGMEVLNLKTGKILVVDYVDDCEPKYRCIIIINNNNNIFWYNTNDIQVIQPPLISKIYD